MRTRIRSRGDIESPPLKYSPIDIRGSTWFTVCVLILVSFHTASGAEETQPLRDILQSMARAGVQLIFSSETVPGELRSELPPSNLSTEKKLEWLLRPADLEARKLSNGAYVIAPSTSGKGQVSVLVTVERNGTLAPLPGATVILGEPHRQAVSDVSGRCDFERLPFGRQKIEASYDGMKSISRSVVLSATSATVQLELRLVDTPQFLEEIRVLGTPNQTDPAFGRTLARDQLETTPTTSSDATRGLQLLPGAAVAGYSAKAHARGSRDDEILYRYDGVELADPYHFEALQSLTSAIDPNITDSSVIWTGISPVRLGGAIGAIVDIAPRSAALSVADVRLSNRDFSLLGGSPFASDQGTILASVHVANNLSPVRWLDVDTAAPNHRDYLLRSTWRFGPNTRLSAGFLAIDDDPETLTGRFTNQSAMIANHERYAWLRVWQSINPWLQSETQLSVERSQDVVDGVANVPGIEVGALSSRDRHSGLTVRQEFTFLSSAGWSVLGGIERTQALVNERLISSASFAAPFVPGVELQAQTDINSQSELRGVSLSPYAEIHWQRDATVLDFGVRHTERRFHAPGQNDAQWSVNANLQRQLSPTTGVHFGIGQASQASVLEGDESATGVLQPASARVLQQVDGGAEHSLGSHWVLREDVYYKSERTGYDSLNESFTPFALLPEIAFGNREVSAASARMLGLELQLESDRRLPLSGWISYTRSRAEDRVADRWIPRSWDQPNAVQLATSWNHGHWHVTGLYSWHSGWALTPLIASSSVWQNPALVRVSLGPQNSERLPGFGSLDARLSWEQALPTGTLQIALELNDVTNSRITCCHNYSVVQTTNGSTLIDMPQSWLGFAPQLTIRWHL